MRLIDKDRLLLEIDNGIKAFNGEEGYEGYPPISTMEDIIDSIRYADEVEISVEKDPSEKYSLAGDGDIVLLRHLRETQSFARYDIFAQETDSIRKFRGSHRGDIRSIVRPDNDSPGWLEIFGYVCLIENGMAEMLCPNRSRTAVHVQGQ